MHLPPVTAEAHHRSVSPFLVARREDLKRADCVEWEPGIGRDNYARTPGVVNNPKNAGRGLPLSDKGQELLEKQRKEAKERR